MDDLARSGVERQFEIIGFRNLTVAPQRRNHQRQLKLRLQATESSPIDLFYNPEALAISASSTMSSLFRSYRFQIRINGLLAVLASSFVMTPSLFRSLLVMIVLGFAIIWSELLTVNGVP